ncbi:sensor histidine kinase [Sphingomonas lenta]|uniref:Sensor histidine kinase n=1 Tax=Sphingomonas lenta TaxID=1141887 RepID=A0A2A2SKS2_9SPHN|nr:histidine kinase [Sphingomonas lenta]PAX09611.1 sensor histidine kinase [Sphingomonas lenta]
MQNGSGNNRYNVRPRTAAISILLFWGFYYLSLSVRSVMMDYPGYREMFEERAAVAVTGMGLTWLLYLVLRSLQGRRLGVQVAAAFLASVPVSAAYAAANYYFLYVHDPQLRALHEGNAVNARAEKRRKPSHTIAQNALHWYFFVACWAALYLALSYASQVAGAERETARLRAATREAELRALRYQVNPHFLFNTLNSISSLVMARRGEQAESMILNLSRFFRTSLAADLTGDVRLEDEIALQRLYLEIEAIRFPERLRTEVTLEPGLEDACVPVMILQPLVENAIKHGVSPSREPVTIRIDARRARGGLRIEVADDGRALAPALGGTGLGLRNVSDRLKLRFGEEAEMMSGVRNEGGFSVVLSVPLVFRGC